MLRAALTTVRRGPRLSRLLSAAATSAVPAPNHQPEVFCNQLANLSSLEAPFNPDTWEAKRQEFKISVSYILSSKPVGTTRDPASKIGN